MLLRPFVLATLLLIKAEAEGSSLRSLGLSSTLGNQIPDSSVVSPITGRASSSSKTSSSSSFKQSSSQFSSSSSFPEIISSKSSYSEQGSSHSSDGQSSVNSSSYAKHSYNSSDKGSSAGDKSCKDPQPELTTIHTPISDSTSSSVSESSSSKNQSSVTSNKKAPSSEILSTVNHQVLTQAQEIVPINYTSSSSSLVGNLSSISPADITKPVAGGESGSCDEQTKPVPESEVDLSATVSSSSGSNSYSSSNKITDPHSNGTNSSSGFQQSYNSQSSPSTSSTPGSKVSKSEQEFSTSPEGQPLVETSLKAGDSYSAAKGSFSDVKPSKESQVLLKSPTLFNPNSYSQSASTVTGSSYLQSSTSNKVSSEISAGVSQKGPPQLGLPSGPVIVNIPSNWPSSVSRFSSTSVNQKSSDKGPSSDGFFSGFGQQVLSRPLTQPFNIIRNRPSNPASTSASLLRSKTSASFSQPSVFSYKGSSAETQQPLPIWPPFTQITPGYQRKSALTNKSSLYSSTKKTSTSQTSSSYSKSSGSMRNSRDTFIPSRFHQPILFNSDETCE